MGSGSPTRDTPRPRSRDTAESAYERPARRDTVRVDTNPHAETPAPGRASGVHHAIETPVVDLDFEDVPDTDSGGVVASGEQLAQPRELDDSEAPQRDSIDPLSIGDTLDERYVLERVLGRGATGVIYEATHTLIGKRVAIKVLHSAMATTPVAVQRLFREARIAAALRHPNVIEIFDAGNDRGTYYLTMELLEGESLTDFLARGLPRVDEIVRMFVAIMDGVAAVHAAGVIHRDLKPDNVFLTRDEDGCVVPKVLDFGVSKLYEPGRQQLTALGMTMGTPYYMAPEQMTDSASVDVRADVFSLGVMLYEALCGRVPYPGESVLEIFNATRAGRPTPLRKLRGDIPPSLEALLARALCPDRNARPADVRALRDALAAVRFDGSDFAQSAAEPWMLDESGAADELAPIETAPTRVANVLESRTVELKKRDLPLARPPRAKPPFWLMVVLGATLLAIVTFSLVVWALFTFAGS